MLHRRVEEQLDLLNPALRIDEYRGVLRAFYGYYEPLEARLAAAAASVPPLGFELAHRALLLERDLVALGDPSAEIASLPRCAELPEIALPAHVAGCLYVLEGAALGGRVISRTLARSLDIGARNGGAFFAGDGPRTAARWCAVLRWIEGLASAEGRCEAIVEAACETFETLACWIDQKRGAA